MPRTSGSALALAASLRALDDATLIALITSRDFREAGTRDFFDLADRLLDPVSVHQALALLDRPALHALSQSQATPTAIALGLADNDGAPYDAVVAVLRAWPQRGLPGQEALAAPPPPPPPAAAADGNELTDRAAAERAFATTTVIVELLAELGRGGARRLVKGGIALPDARRLGEATGASPDELPVLLAIAASAGLVTDDAGPWVATPESREWLASSTAHRWVALARAWFDHVPEQMRAVLSDNNRSSWGDHLASYTRWLFPANADEMQASARAHVVRAELLGIAADGVPSTAGSAVLRGDDDTAVAAVHALFPPTVDKAYIQRDLSIVSTGPLDAAIDSRLRTMADVESAGLATTWRISSHSIESALANGDTAGGIREFLEQLSLTGIPQPLDYLIDETERRHGLVRVGATEIGSYVRSTDEVLLRQIAVDRMIANLGFRVVDKHLESRFDRDIVYWTLVEGRYPVAAEDASGAIEIVHRTRREPHAAPKRNTAEELVTRLRAGTDDTSDGAWLERQLDVAVRARTLVTVTVELPSGERVDYELEPTGIGGGRLRGRDKKADIERTLPLTSIVDVKS
jgi:hypothetical protein